MLLTTTAAGVAIDLASKWWAFQRVAGFPVVVRREDVLAAPRLADLLPRVEAMVVIPDLLHFSLVLNPGAVFGIGAGKRWFFVAFTLGALLFALYMFARWTRHRDWASHIAIGLLIAGALGNLYDRLVYACVRDFIHPLPGWKLPFGWTINGTRELWPYVSNIADAFLLIAIGMLLINSWVKEHRRNRGERGHTNGHSNSKQPTTTSGPASA